jgi:hypothetical protein
MKTYIFLSLEVSRVCQITEWSNLNYLFEDVDVDIRTVLKWTLREVGNEYAD